MSLFLQLIVQHLHLHLQVGLCAICPLQLHCGSLQ